MSKVQTVPADNLAELTAVLQTTVISPVTGEKVSVTHHGPFYPDMIKTWVESTVEKSGAVFSQYFVRDIKDLSDEEIKKLNGGVNVKPYRRFLNTNEDGVQTYSYSI